MRGVLAYVLTILILSGQAFAQQTHNPIPGSNATFLPDLQNFLKNEDAQRFTDMFAPFVVSGGTHGTVAGLTATPSFLTAYPGGYFTSENLSITYPDNSTCWVVATYTTTSILSGAFFRVNGTHYALDCTSVVQPIAPLNSVFLMKVTTSGGAITAVTDLRNTNPVAGQPWINVAQYGVKGDGATDNYAALANLISQAPNGSIIFFPCGTYLTSGGFITNKSLSIKGAGSCTIITQTGTTGSSVLFYIGGATPNGTPNPGYPGTVYNAGSGGFPAGTTTFTLTNATGLNPGDEVFMDLGVDPQDGGQHFSRMFNIVASVNGNQVTMATPIPESITAFPGTPAYSWSPTFNEIVKFTNGIVQNISVESMIINQSGSAFDVSIFIIRARNARVKDVMLVNNQKGVAFGEVESGVIENLYCGQCAQFNPSSFVELYGLRDFMGRNLQATSLVNTGIQVENQCRGVILENVNLQANLSKGTNPFFSFHGGSTGILLRNFHINNVNQPNALAMSVLDITQVQTENAFLWNNINGFPLKYHRGQICYNGACYRDVKPYRISISLTNSMAGTSFTLPTGLLRVLRGGITDKTGVTQVLFANTSGNAFDALDTSNSIDYFPAAGSFGDLTSDFGVTLGTVNTYALNQDTTGKKVKITTTTVGGGSPKLYLYLEYFVPIVGTAGNDGVNGSLQDAF